MTGVKLSKEAYAASAIVFLPINSAAIHSFIQTFWTICGKSFVDQKRPRKTERSLVAPRHVQKVCAFIKMLVKSH